MASKLDHEVARETVWTLNNDRARAVTEKSFQAFRETGTVADGVCAAYRSVIEGLHDLVTRASGVGPDGRALALVAVLVGIDPRTIRASFGLSVRRPRQRRAANLVMLPR